MYELLICLLFLLKCITDKYQVGQNVAQSYSSGENDYTMQNFIDLWYNEVENFDARRVNQPFK